MRPVSLPGRLRQPAKFRAERRSRNRRRYRNDRGWRSHGGNSAPDPARHAHLRTSMESHRLLPFIAGFAISAALAVARRRRLRHGARPQPAQQPAPGAGRPAHRRLRPVVAGPLPRAGRGVGGGLGGIPLVAAALALALAGLAGATALVTTRKTLPAFAGLALLTLGVAYAHSLFATPGLFRASAALGSWGPAGAILVLATMLVGLGLEFKPSRKVRVARVARRGDRRPAADAGRRRAGRRRRRRCCRPGPRRCCSPPWSRPARCCSRPLGARAGPRPRAGAARRRRRRRAAGRQPDPAADPRLLRGPPRRRRDQGRRQRQPPGAAVHRPRRLQAGQRHLRPLDRRPRARAGRPAPEGDVARQGRGRPGRRRRVPAPAHQRPDRGGGGAGRRRA